VLASAPVDFELDFPDFVDPAELGLDFVIGVGLFQGLEKQALFGDA
jgi:hypothetical protein